MAKNTAGAEMGGNKNDVAQAYISTKELWFQKKDTKWVATK